MMEYNAVHKAVSEIYKTDGQKEESTMPKFDTLNQSDRWHRMVRAARRALEEQGYQVERMPGRGLANIMRLTKEGKTELASIRTTQDRWYAYNPLPAGGWKTLDEVEWVVVAAVDKPGAVEKIIVHLFPADDVRKRFNDSLQARLAAGYPKKDFAMWVGLDTDTSGSPGGVGSGIADVYQPIGVYDADDLAAVPGASMPDAEATLAEAASDSPVRVPPQEPTSVTPATTASKPGPTIADVLTSAREQIARIAGVPTEMVRLELKIGA